MRKQPLSETELQIAQKMFECLTPGQKEKLVDLQDRIEECEGVNMEYIIKGGIPFEFWCDSCKKTYSRMYYLLMRWYKRRVLNVANEFMKNNSGDHGERAW